MERTYGEVEGDLAIDLGLGNVGEEAGLFAGGEFVGEGRGVDEGYARGDNA